MRTLPDYLTTSLELVFIGINPSIKSMESGHYFANPRNRFWAAFNSSGIALETIHAETDHSCLKFGVGFTDLVKRPTKGVKDLKSAEYREGAYSLKSKLVHSRPLVACFLGLMGYSRYLRYAEGIHCRVRLGLQEETIGPTKIFVLPNPSPANAAVGLECLISWFQVLKRVVSDAKGLE